MYPPPDDSNKPTPANPSQRYVTVRLPNVKPVLTYVFMGLSILVFLLQIFTQMTMGVDLPTVWGAKANDLIIQGQLWRFFTPMFLHGSITHLLFNMYALYVFGPTLERSYGHWRFLGLFVLSGFAGNVLSFLFTQGPSVGSSTAIFGLLGAEGVFLYRNRQLFGAQAQRALSNLVIVAVLNLMLGAASSIGGQARIDNWGHMGGLLGGTFFAWFAGPVYELYDDYSNPHLQDQHTTQDAVRTGLIGFVIFGALAAMKMFQ